MQGSKWRTALAPLRRISRFGAVCTLYLAIVWSFDYIYFPWLTLKFRSLVFLPLFLSIFLVSWAGYYLHEYFQEDVLLTGRIGDWLNRPGKGGIGTRIKTLIVGNPRCTFAAIATWWSPLHAYLFFNRDPTFRAPSFIKALAKGSFYCALFWGVVGESILFSWQMAKHLLR
ncbi:MAG: hypothetical protein LAN62_04440 [Acidobacteriia bacterium]|nr:hypothetical protein [Terriglobia bacterium]